MKKTLSFFLTALLLLALLAGCGANAPAPQPAEEQPVPAEDVPVQSGASLLGGWTVPDSFALTDENRPAFENAVAELVGVNYEPLACLGTQLVNGTNRAFFCRAQVVYPGAQPFFAIVYVYEALDGSAKITDIESITPDGRFDENAGSAQALTGGWTVPEEDGEALAAFEQAAEKLLGVDYTPVAVMGQQVVSGMNYCLLCQARAVSPDAQPYYCFVQVYRDLQGSAEIMKITAIGDEEVS